MKVAKRYEMDSLGKTDLQKAKEKGDKLYARIAKEEDYKKNDMICKYLRKNADLKTILDVEQEKERKKRNIIVQPN